MLSAIALWTDEVNRQAEMVAAAAAATDAERNSVTTKQDDEPTTSTTVISIITAEHACIEMYLYTCIVMVPPEF